MEDIHGHSPDDLPKGSEEVVLIACAIFKTWGVQGDHFRTPAAFQRRGNTSEPNEKDFNFLLFDSGFRH